MSKYKVRRCENQNHEKWCVCVDGTPNRIFDTEGEAIVEAERLQTSWDAMAERIKKQDGVLSEANIVNGWCHGPVLQSDTLHALQRTGRGTYIIHQQVALSQRLAAEQIAEIKYLDGRGTVTIGKEKERGKGR